MIRAIPSAKQPKLLSVWKAVIAPKVPPYTMATVSHDPSALVLSVRSCTNRGSKYPTTATLGRPNQMIALCTQHMDRKNENIFTMYSL